MVGGVPARLIRKRFQEDEIAALERIQWWDKSIDWFEENGDMFSNLEEFLMKYDN